MTKHRKLWPEEWEQGLIKTKNAMGVMFKELSPSARAFVDFAKTARLPLLDIGAAYGVTTIPALENGAQVIACDLSEEQLNILHQSVDETHQSNLTLLAAKFPEDLNLKNESLSGILISNVLHFMDGPSIVEGLKRCWQWLEQNGKLYITVMTPHLSFYYPLVAEYAKRESEGYEWPGIFNPKPFATEQWKTNLPDFVHLFEIDALNKLVINAGFAIEDSHYFCYKDYPDEHRNDGKEFISLIATKIEP